MATIIIESMSNRGFNVEKRLDRYTHTAGKTTLFIARNTSTAQKCWWFDRFKSEITWRASIVSTILRWFVEKEKFMLTTKLSTPGFLLLRKFCIQHHVFKTVLSTNVEQSHKWKHWNRLYFRFKISQKDFEPTGPNSKEHRFSFHDSRGVMPWSLWKQL